MCMTVLLVPIDISKYTYGQMDFARNGLKKHVYLQMIIYKELIKVVRCILFILCIYIHKCDLDINVICSFVDINYPILRLFLSSITWTILFIFSQFQRKAHCI